MLDFGETRWDHNHIFPLLLYLQTYTWKYHIQSYITIKIGLQPWKSPLLLRSFQLRMNSKFRKKINTNLKILKFLLQTTTNVLDACKFTSRNKICGSHGKKNTPNALENSIFEVSTLFVYHDFRECYFRWKFASTKNICQCLHQTIFWFFLFPNFTVH